MKGLLNGTVRLVMLQFSFSNVRALPAGLFEKEQETLDELTARRSGVKGVQFIEPIQDVSLFQFLLDLVKAGYVLVDAFFQMRSSARGQQYPVVRFIFAAKESARRDGEFARHKQNAENALLQMCQEAMWRVRAFLNPFFKDGLLVDGQHAISINLEARNPLLDGEGNPLMRWEKDENGEKVGDKPFPLEPKLFLHIDDGNIIVAPTQEKVC